MAPVPKPKRDKIYTETLEWLIGDRLPFSTLDSNAFKVIAKSYISNLDPPCSSIFIDQYLTAQKKKG
jgi:hypothetical protein